MTLKYPSSWGSGSAAKTYPSVSAYTPMTGKVSSSFPTLKGATGNTLYPPPRTSSSSSSFPSLSSWGTGSTLGGSTSSSPKASYPSVSDYFGKLTAPQSAPKTTYPTLSLPNRPSGGILGGASAPPVAGSGMTPSSFFSKMSMPQGFSSAALSGGGNPASTQPPPAAAPQAAPARTTTPAPGQGYGMTSPSAAKVINAQAAKNPSPLVIPGVGGQGGKTTYYTGPRGANPDGTVGVEITNKTPSPAGGYQKTFVDPTTGMTYRFQDSIDDQSPVAGISANGTVLRMSRKADGTYNVYDSGVWARPPISAHAPPVAIPASNAPTQDEIDAANQGRWLG